MLFSGYKIYKVYTEPIIKLDKIGTHFHNARFDRNRKRKIKVDWKNSKRKGGGYNYYKIFKFFSDVRGFKRKYRRPFQLMKIHHIAIICSHYEVSKKFYTEVLGLKILHEVYREERQSYKLDLGIGENYVIELFSFPNPPKRPSQPESCGLRHLAFAVENVDEKRAELLSKQIFCEAIRTDEFTGKKFFFIADPDGLPLEFYEI